MSKQTLSRIPTLHPEPFKPAKGEILGYSQIFESIRSQIPLAEAVIVTVPFLLPCAIPDARTEAKLGLDDFHETPLRLVATLPSLNVPVAVNLIDVPFSMRGFAGETAIETR